MANRLQNKIANSRNLLPFTIVYGIGIWLLSDLLQQQLWISCILMFATTFAMAELNNQHALMRTYSRTISCAFLILSLSAISLFVAPQHGIIQLCFALTYFYLFRAYQDKTAIRSVFNAFFFIGLASIWFVQILFFIPIWWVVLSFYVVGMSWKAFWASLIGVLAPYWFVSGYDIYQNRFDLFIQRFTSLISFSAPFHFNVLTDIQVFTFVFIAFLGLLGMVHFLINSSKEKIRIRLLFSSFMLMMLATILFMMLQPQHYSYLLPILIVSVSPLIGHFISFSSSRLSGITCICISCITLIVTCYQLWMRS